jgi:hypothetical protein
MRSFEPLKKIENVVKGNTATIQLPINNTYDRIYLQIAGVTKAQIKNIRLELNGRLVFDHKDALRMEEIDAYYKRNIETDVIAIHFNEDDLTRTFEEGAFFGLATYGLQTATISFDIDAAATAPAIKAYAEKSEPFGASGQWIKKTRTYPFSVAAGLNELTTIPRPDGASIKAIHLRKSDVTAAELVIDNTKWFELDKAINEQMQKRYGRQPDADLLSIDFMLQGKLSECLPLTNAIQDMRLRATCTTGGTLEVVVEYYDIWTPNSF